MPIRRNRDGVHLARRMGGTGYYTVSKFADMDGFMFHLHTVEPDVQFVDVVLVSP